MQSDSIELIPVGQPVGALKWQMSMNGAAPQGQGNYPAVNVGYNQTDDITFTIKHPGSIKFAQKDAFCAQAGTNKPTNCDAQFTYTGGGTTKLVVHDSNTSAGTYTYVINFNDNVPQLDPIIKNGGNGIVGGIGGYSATALVEIGAVALLAVLLIVLVARRFSSSAQNRTKGP